MANEGGTIGSEKKPRVGSVATMTRGDEKQVKYLMDSDMKELVESFTKTSNSVRAACAASWAWVPTA